MREALIITVILIFLSLLLGVMYNIMAPYLVKLGVISQKEEEMISLSKDGGVFRAEDFGGSWVHATREKNDGEFSKSAVFDMQIHPSNPAILYAATSRGFYVSYNSGGEWEKIATGLRKEDEFVQSFAIDPKNPSTLYLAVSSGQQGRILKSKGGDFYEVYSTTSAKDKMTGVWVDSYDPSTVYAGSLSGLFLESKDFGESWRVKREFQAPIRGLFMTPQDTRIMYLAVLGGKLFRTVNQGSTFDDISGSFPSSPISFEIHNLAIDSRNRNVLYVAASSGLLKSVNQGNSFSSVNLLVPSGTASTFAVALNPADQNIIYAGIGSQIHRSSDGGKSWQIKQLETARKIRVIKVKPDDAKTIFVGVDGSF